MSILSGVSDFFGLDLGTAALRAVQLKSSGSVKALNRYGEANLQGTLTLSDSAADQTKLSQSVRDLIKQAGITTTNVAVNLPSQRVFTTVTDWDKMPAAELAKTIRYQAESIIPTPLNESQIDWAILGDSPKDARKMEVLLSSVPSAFVEARLDMLESIGLNVIAFEPDALAMVRALLPPDANATQMVLNVGGRASDIIIAINGVPHLMRAVPVGWDSLVRMASQNLNVDAAQAQQFIYKFGISPDKLEGKVHAAIIGTIDGLMAEIDKSVKFFHDRYPHAALERIIVTGGAAVVPELPLYIANRFGLNIEIGNAWRNVSFPPAQQNELLTVSNHFAVAAGLAERKE